MTSPLLLVCAVCLKCAVDFFWHGIGVELLIFVNITFTWRSYKLIL